jgi:hypothetical protein
MNKPNYYILIKDVDYFGTIIKKGAVYIRNKKDRDNFTPHIEGNICPSQSLSFYFVESNDDYFVPFIKPID